MTASNFSACLAFTLRYEGGKVDDPRDPGGRTNQGVTQRTFDRALAAQGRPARDVYAMTTAERDAIYRGGFWDAVKGDGLPEGVDLALFDFGVNSGPARALAAYARRGSNDAAAVVRHVCATRLSFLHALGTFRVFGRGWTARVAACEALGVTMAEHARIGLPPGAPTAPPVGSALAASGHTAAARAGRHRAQAAGVATIGAAALTGLQTTGAQAALHVPLAVLLAGGSALGLVVAWLAWRAMVHGARSRAYASAAQVAAPAVGAAAADAPS